MPKFELRGIDAGYGSAKVLFSVDLALPEKSIVALLGPNGAGKTTTLRVASGLLKPNAGTIWLDGKDVTGVSPRVLARQGLCLIPEGRGIFPNLTVKENLHLHTYLRSGLQRDAVEEIAYERFPILSTRRSQTAGTLSGGQQQMLALSRALTTAPTTLLLDEISMGLAPIIVEDLFRAIQDIAREGVSVLIVEQLAQFALEIADRAVILNQGVVTAQGSPDEVRDALASNYMGGAAPAATS